MIFSLGEGVRATQHTRTISNNTHNYPRKIKLYLMLCLDRDGRDGIISKHAVISKDGKSTIEGEQIELNSIHL